MRSQFLSPGELNNWRLKIVENFYSDPYINRIMQDPRAILQQEARKSLNRGKYGETWLRRK